MNKRHASVHDCLRYEQIQTRRKARRRINRKKHGRYRRTRVKFSLGNVDMPHGTEKERADLKMLQDYYEAERIALQLGTLDVTIE